MKRNSANGVRAIVRSRRPLCSPYFVESPERKHIVDISPTVLLDGGYPAEVVKTDALCNITQSSPTWPLLSSIMLIGTLQKTRHLTLVWLSTNSVMMPERIESKNLVTMRWGR